VSENPRPVQMIRACSPGLDQGRLHCTMRVLRGAQVLAMGGTNLCPAHDDLLSDKPHGVCLDNFWSQQHLAGLSLREAWRLWRSWRKAVRR
jgi:hypothetical protein